MGEKNAFKKQLDLMMQQPSLHKDFFMNVLKYQTQSLFITGDLTKKYQITQKIKSRQYNISKLFENPITQNYDTEFEISTLLKCIAELKKA